MGCAAVTVTPPDECGDDALLARVAQGDQLAFRCLLDRHLARVVGAARRVTGDAMTADDVAQETFLQLWRRSGDLVNQSGIVNGAGGSGVGPVNVGAWLRRVAVNGAIDRLRANRRIDPTAEVPELSEAPDQAVAIDRADAASRVHAAVAALPERQQTALKLFHFEEMSQRDVAAAMDISEDALESLLARARRKLKTYLKDDIADLLRSLSDEPSTGVDGQ